MKKKWSQREIFPYLKKTVMVYIILAVLALLLVLFFNVGLTRFFVARSKYRAIIMFFLLPLLALLTRPYGDNRAIGLIYAWRKKEKAFVTGTIKYWLAVSFTSVVVSFFLYYWELYEILVGFANWIYCFSFLSLLINLVPEPPPPLKGASLPIAVWGPRSSGKTVFLAMLYKDLANSDWQMDITDPEISQYIIEIRESLDNAKWPPPTDPSAKKNKNTYSLHFSHKRPSYPYMGLTYFSLNVQDPSGELFENFESEHLKPEKEEFFKSFTQCKGALFIIDHRYSEKSAALHAAIYSNMAKIQKQLFTVHSQFHIQFPVAICVSKIDERYEDFQEMKHNPEKFFIKLFGHQTFNLLKESIKNFKIFFFSAVGVKEENGKWVPRLTEVEGQAVPDEVLQPFGLFEPVEWIIQKARSYKQ